MQSAVVQADLDLDRFMRLVTTTVQEMTNARGAVVELVDGDNMAYRCTAGSRAVRRLARAAAGESKSKSAGTP